MVGLEHPTLAVAALVAGSAGAVYLHLGRTLARRPAPQPAHRRALRMFALWWLATGTNIVLASILIAAAALGGTDASLQAAYGVLQRLLLAVALVGLIHYLLVLVRGRAPTVAVAWVYAAYFAFLLAQMYANDPSGVYVGQWRTDLEYANAGAVPAWVSLVSFAWLVLPPVALSVAAVAVARRLGPSQAAQRNRITLVGLALVTWWVVAVVAGQREAYGQEFYQVFNRLLGLAMALVILWAYQPPAWLRRHVELPAA